MNIQKTINNIEKENNIKKQEYQSLLRNRHDKRLLTNINFNKTEYNNKTHINFDETMNSFRSNKTYFNQLNNSMSPRIRDKDKKIRNTLYVPTYKSYSFKGSDNTPRLKSSHMNWVGYISTCVKNKNTKIPNRLESKIDNKRNTSYSSTPDTSMYNTIQGKGYVSTKPRLSILERELLKDSQIDKMDSDMNERSNSYIMVNKLKDSPNKIINNELSNALNIKNYEIHQYKRPSKKNKRISLLPKINN